MNNNKLNLRELLLKGIPFIFTWAFILSISYNNLYLGFIVWFAGVGLATFHNIYHTQAPIFSLVAGMLFSWSYFYYFYFDN